MPRNSRRARAFQRGTHPGLESIGHSAGAAGVATHLPAFGIRPGADVNTERRLHTTRATARSSRRRAAIASSAKPTDVPRSPRATADASTGRCTVMVRIAAPLASIELHRGPSLIAPALVGRARATAHDSGHERAVRCIRALRCLRSLESSFGPLEVDTGLVRRSLDRTIRTSCATLVRP